MNLHLHNVNLTSTTGPNSFAQKLVDCGTKSGWSMNQCFRGWMEYTSIQELTITCKMKIFEEHTRWQMESFFSQNLIKN